MAQPRDVQEPVQAAGLCFGGPRKCAIIVGSQVAKLAVGKKAASFVGLLHLGVKRAGDVKFRGSQSHEERTRLLYVESLRELILTNPLDVASEIRRQLGDVVLGQWLKHELRFGVKNNRPIKPLEALQNLDAKVLTTNYDTALENALCADVCRNSRTLNILTSDYGAVQDLITGNSDEQAVLHLFGVFNDSLVFCKSDHEQYIQDQSAMLHLSTLFYQSHVLFVGFERNDPFMKTLFEVMEMKMSKYLGQMRNRHYCLIPDSELQSFNQEFPGILPLCYGSSNDDLIHFLEMVANTTGAHKIDRRKRRLDDAHEGLEPSKKQRIYIVSENEGTIPRLMRSISDDLIIPQEDVELGMERGPFTSIYFSIDVAEKYVPWFWQQAQMPKNVFMECGVMAIQIGTGPMLWISNPPLPHQAGPDLIEDAAGGGWRNPKRKRKAWELPEVKSGQVRKTSVVSMQGQKDILKQQASQLKQEVQKRFGCYVSYQLSKSNVTFHCQGAESDVDKALKYLQQPTDKKKEHRQFACQCCDCVWWAWVPKDKTVTSCPQCHTCLKALRRRDQYGFADFQCNCGCNFEGRDRFGKWSGLECPLCEQNVRPRRIRPPHKSSTHPLQDHTVAATAEAEKPVSIDLEPISDEDVSDASSVTEPTRSKQRIFLPKYRETKGGPVRRNVWIPSEPHDCTGDTDDETRNAGRSVRLVKFFFVTEVF